MRRQLITGPKRKRIVMMCLTAVSVVTVVLSLKIAIQESSLPIAKQLNESRLLEPNIIDPEEEKIAPDFIETNEGQLSEYVQCSAAAASGSKQACLEIINRLLSSNPSNGRLWLEKAKIITGETGLDEQAVFALQKSFEYSAREGWVSKVRTRFVLSVWTSFAPEIQTLATSNILEIIADDESQIQNLVDLYSFNPLARAGISAVIEKASVDIQRRFLGLLRANLKI